MTDDAKELQHLFDRAARGQAIPRLAAHRYRVDTPLTIGPTMGARIQGDGGLVRSDSPGWKNRRHATSIEWAGDPDAAILTLAGFSGGTIDQLTFEGAAKTAIQFEHANGTLNNTIRDVAIHHCATGIAHAREPNHQTCANVSYYDLYFENVTTALKLNNSQSVEHLLLRPTFALCETAIHARAGGAIIIVGGGSYELDTLLRIDRVGSNTRGFHVTGFRFDGERKRTRWLDFAEPQRPRTAGNILFLSCSQNQGQLESDAPLITVCPGARVTTECCNFNEKADNLLGALAHLTGTASHAAEYYAIRCDGIDGDRLETYATLHRSRARAKFEDCGTLRSPTGSFTDER